MPDQRPFVDRLRSAVDHELLWSDLKLVAGGGFLVFWGVSASDTDERGALLVGVAGLVLLGFAFWRARRRRSPDRHPLVTGIAAQGEPNLVTRELNAEFGTDLVRRRKMLLSSGWLCYVGDTRAVVKRFDQLAWVYVEKIGHRINMIPWRPASYQILVWDRDGKGEVLPMSKKAAAAGLTRLGELAPWLPVGYSEVLKETWNADRREFLMMIEARRSQYKSGSSWS